MLWLTLCSTAQTCGKVVSKRLSATAVVNHNLIGRLLHAADYVAAHKLLVENAYGQSECFNSDGLLYICLTTKHGRSWVYVSAGLFNKHLLFELHNPKTGGCLG